MKKSVIVPAIVLIGYLSYHMVKNWSRDGERYRQHSKIFRWGYIIGILSSLLMIWGERLLYSEMSDAEFVYGVTISDMGLLIFLTGVGIVIYTGMYWKIEEAKLIKDLELRETEIAKMKKIKRKLLTYYWGFILVLVAILVFLEIWRR